MKLYYLSSWLLLFGLISFSVGCSDHHKTLLFLGDSMTAGDGVEEEYTFPTLIEQQMNGYRSINQARSGWSTSSYLKRWEEVEDDFPARADIIFIQLGTSDLQVSGHSDSTVINCLENMKVILTRINNRFPKAEIVLMSSTNIDDSAMNEVIKKAGFGEWTNLYLGRIAGGYSVIATDFGYSFIDIQRTVPIHTTYDGAHLDKNGHNIVAKVILSFLRKLIGEDQGNV